MSWKIFHFTPRMSRSRIRFALRLVTSISSTLRPVLRKLPTGALKGTLKRPAASLPLMNTRALSRTSPRSSSHSSAPAGMSISIEYRAVPAKHFASSSPISVQDFSSFVVISAGSFGPPSMKVIFQMPLTTSGSLLLVSIGHRSPSIVCWSKVRRMRVSPGLSCR